MNTLIKSLSIGGGLVAASLAVGCAKTLPPEQPVAKAPVSLGSNELRDADNIILVTDASASTYFERTFPQNKAVSQSLAKNLPDRNVRANSSTYNVGVIGFGGDDRVVLPLQNFDRGAVESTVDQIEIMGSIDGFGGTTPITEVIGEAGAQLEGQSGKAAIVIVSDGEADDPRGALAAASALAEARPNTCFHTVQTGDSALGGEFLRRLAATTNCGSARAANTINTASNFDAFTTTVVAGAAPPAPPPVAAAPDPCAGTIRLRGINFAFDSAEIDPAGAAVLDVAAETLERCRAVNVKVEGYTDSTGPADYNMGLSKRRANSAAGYIAGQGVDADRLDPVGFGENDPVASNDTREGRAKNRRVDLVPVR